MKKNVPELSEIYTLLDQDFNQRNISPVLNATAFQVTAHVQSVPLINAAQTSFPAKQNRPVCAHCGYNGHTVDTCYKIHGYHVGFKHKGKQQTDKSSSNPKYNNSSKPIVAQVGFVDSVSNVVNNLTKDQIEGVIAYFNSQLKTRPDQVNCIASSSSFGGMITALPGMSFSSSTL